MKWLGILYKKMRRYSQKLFKKFFKQIFKNNVSAYYFFVIDDRAIFGISGEKD